MPLIEKLKELGITKEEICERDEKVLQTELAPIFRYAAIHHLKEDVGDVAEGFRKSYSIIAGIGERGAIGKEKKIDDFLANQEKDKVFGTYIEAAALGELLNCNIEVTSITKSVEQTKHCLYTVKRVNKDEASPTIHLYCENNNHWYMIRNHPKKTLRDGNCLYNAFAQLFKKIVIEQSKKVEEGPVASRLRSKNPTFFTPDIEKQPIIPAPQSVVEVTAPIPAVENVHDQTESPFMIGLRLAMHLSDNDSLYTYDYR